MPARTGGSLSWRAPSRPVFPGPIAIRGASQGRGLPVACSASHLRLANGTSAAAASTAAEAVHFSSGASMLLRLWLDDLSSRRRVLKWEVAS